MSDLVLGAAGFLGLNLVDELRAQGELPRCGRRKRTNVLALRQRKVPLVQADLDTPEELLAAMEGVTTVYHLAGHYPRFSNDGDAAVATGLAQLDRVLDAAAGAGVRRVVYVSSTATVAPVVGRSATEADVFERCPDFGVYHRLKWEMEARALAETRVEVSVACPAACLGPWDLRVGTSALLVALARSMDPPHPDGIVSWVDARDVARALVQVARAEAPPRRVLLSAGSLGLHDLMTQLARRYGVPPPQPPLSDEDARAFADAEEARALAEGGRAALAREIVDLIVHGVPLDASLSQQALGVGYRPLNETLDAFDAWARSLRILSTPAPTEFRT